MRPEQRYISNELTHFIGAGDNSDDERYIRLCKILREGRLRGEPWGSESEKLGDHPHVDFFLNRRLSENEMFNPNMVCFCDIPVQEFGIHMRKYGTFGIAFEKDFIARQGGIPVYYVPKNGLLPPGMELDGKYFDKGVHDLLSYLIGEMSRQLPSDKEGPPPKVEELKIHKKLQRQIVEHLSFLCYYFFSYVKVFDHKLPDIDEKNYYFEREWRLLGVCKFGVKDVRRILIPESFCERFRNDFPIYYGQLTFTVEQNIVT